MPVIVTGASQNHYKTLCQFIRSYIQYKTPSCFLVVYNLGIEKSDWIQLQRDFSTENIVYKVFEYLKYPAFFNININCGEYAWKPALIYETCEEYGGTLIWMDAGNLIHQNLESFFKLVEEDGLYTATSEGDLPRWTHPKTLEFMKCDTSNYSNQNRNAACIGFNYTVEWVRSLVKEWRDLALIKDCIAPEGSSRQNHRQDQSVFSILYYKYQKMIGFHDRAPLYVSFVSTHHDID